MEEEITRLETKGNDFRAELETVSRKAELDTLKKERDVLIAKLREERAGLRDDFENEVRKEREHLNELRELENAQVNRWETELKRRESESERERVIWENERSEMIKQERLRWEQQLRDRDEQIQKMRLEFQKWQEEMRVRVEEDKRHWVEDHEKRLEAFENRMRDVFEMDKIEALKQYVNINYFHRYMKIQFSHTTTTTTDTKAKEKSSSRNGMLNSGKEKKRPDRNGKNNINVLRVNAGDISRKKT